MTADPRRRRRQTRVGALAAVVLVLVGAVAAVVGVSTLRTSEAGSAPASDTRVEVAFPSTPTIAIGVVDDENRLASLVVGVVSPAGAGGSLVSVPVNVDTTIGFGDERSTLGSRPYVPGDAESLEALTFGLESTLSITVQHALVLGPDEVLAVVERVAPLEVDLPDDVIDADSDPDEVAEAGVATLDAATIAAAMTAIDIDGTTYSHHDLDVALWAAFARAASSSPLDVDVPLDGDDRPIDPTGVDEAFERLLAGSVAHRDLAIDIDAAADAVNPDEADFVIVDRSDALLVFGEIAPGLVSKPNESLSFQIIAPFSDEQIAAAGDGVTTVELMHDLIGELLFAQGNVVSVQTSPSVDGAGEVTRLEVSDEDFVEAVAEVAPLLFGEVDVVVASRLIEGVDVVAVLGTGFLDRRAEIAAEAATSSTTDPATDSETDDGESVDGESVDSETADGDATAVNDESDATSDTVAADE
jgi:hypothetical protein